MGNDGGSIPKRSEVVKQKKNNVEVDKAAKAVARSTLCAISKEPLRSPIVACKRGLLYNKEQLIKRLLEKTMPYEFRHIRKLTRDTYAVTISQKIGEQGIQCAVSSQQLNGITKFYIGSSCGCLLSDSALKMVGSADSKSKEESKDKVAL